MKKAFSIQAYNRQSVLITWKDQEEILERRLSATEQIKAYYKDEVSINHGAISILVLFINRILTPDDVNHLEELVGNHDYEMHELASQSYKLPIYYDEAAADLKVMSQQLNLSVEQIVELHLKAVYTVDFIGFLPGFPYLQGLDSQLFVNRKNTPSRKVEAGSVAIANGYCGIYPQESPAGWYVIGHCPIPMLRSWTASIETLKPNDKISFYAVDKVSYESLKDDSESSLKDYVNG